MTGHFFKSNKVLLWVRYIAILLIYTSLSWMSLKLISTKKISISLKWKLIFCFCIKIFIKTGSIYWFQVKAKQQQCSWTKHPLKCVPKNAPTTANIWATPQTPSNLEAQKCPELVTQESMYASNNDRFVTNEGKSTV